MTPTERWAAELRRTLKERGWTPRQLAEELDADRSSITEVLAGRHLPTYARGVAIADALLCPRLADLIREAHTGACDICGASYVNVGHNRTRRYCGHQCQKAAARRQSVEHGRRKRGLSLQIAAHRLEDHQQAVDAFCRRCGEDACPDAKCELRKVSPLPLLQVQPRRAA